jgi:hypothetical protein
LKDGGAIKGGGVKVGGLKGGVKVGGLKGGEKV